VDSGRVCQRKEEARIHVCINHCKFKIDLGKFSIKILFRALRNRRGNYYLFVVFDIIFEISYFITCKKTNIVANIVTLFKKNISKLHGFLRSITLDSDTIFRSLLENDMEEVRVKILF